MSGLFSTLSVAARGLAAQQEVMDTASNNINNANTPGYSRETAVLQTVAPTEQVNGVAFGGGVTVSGVTQARNSFLEAQIPQALGSAAYYSAQSSALQGFSGFNSSTTGGLGPAVSGFYSSLTALEQNPSDSGLRTSFLGAAQTLAQTFNSTSQQVASAQSGIDQQVSGLATEVNTELTAVAQLNGQIGELGGSSAQSATLDNLLDQRQTHLDNLAQYVGATTVPTSSGEVNVILPGGQTLVAGSSAGSLSTQPDPSNGGHLAVVLTQPDGTRQSTPLPDSALGGTLGGAISARDGALETVGQEVGQLADDMINGTNANGLNAIHEKGYGLDGSTNNPLFTISPTGNITVAITDPQKLAMASSANAPGDAGNAQALLATESTPLSGGQDVQSTLSGMVSQFGSASATSQALSTQDGAMANNLTQMRDSYSGVSIDEEMITMQQAERGYQALAQVITTTNDMLSTLLAIPMVQ